MIPYVSIDRIHYGFMIAPPDSRDAGQPIPICGYLIRHPEGLVLFDTGIAPVDQATRQRYSPRASSVTQALAGIGVAPGDISMVVNCHLHADHAGGNDTFPQTPIYIQRRELEAAEATDYTRPESTHGFPGARLVVIDGDVPVRSDLRILATPGHSPGHQSLAVETDRGWILLAGQVFDTASEFGFAAYARRLSSAGLAVVGSTPAWMDGVAELDPVSVLFAHDLGRLDRDDSQIGTPVPL